jgi:hypothetical protein
MRFQTIKTFKKDEQPKLELKTKPKSRVTRRLGKKIHPIFGKSSQSSCLAKIYQNSYNRSLFESPKHFRVIGFFNEPGTLE